MKKLIIAATVLLSMSFVACKKDYRCECSKTRTGGTSTLTTDDGSYTFKDTRTRAESRCNDQEGSGSDAFGDYTRDCQIK
jgi:hypothetical protein